MKTNAIGTLFAALLLFTAAPALAEAGQPAPAPPALAARPDHVVTDANHVVTEAEIQAGIDQQIHSEAADRQAIRDLLARPEVQRVVGQAGLSLTRANDAIANLSGPELQRLASQAREVNSQAIGGD